MADEAMIQAVDDLGRAIDRVDNLQHALLLPMPAAFHIEQLKAIIPEAVAELKAAFVKVTGENPWSD